MKANRHFLKTHEFGGSKMKYYLLGLLLVLSWSLLGQNKTDVSLYLKKDKDKYLQEIESESGNLFTRLGHHGPAVENKLVAYRMYFDKKTAIDVYSKAKPGLEIRDKKWYPSKKDQGAGYGADYYKVGKTVGLGGVKLWDGEKVVPLHPVRKRSAKVFQKADGACMEMLSEGVPYKGKEVDILVRVSVFDEKREALVEAFSQTGEEVQFVTGINYFENLKVVQQKDYVATWGIHPEDVAAEKVKVGAALVFNPNDMEKRLDDGKQHLLISKPAIKLQTTITSANEREAQINTFERFLLELESLDLHLTTR